MYSFRASTVLGVVCAISILALGRSGSCADLPVTSDVLNGTALLAQCKQQFMDARPRWSEAQCDRLAEIVVAQLASCTRVDLNNTIASNLLNYIVFDLHKVDSSAHDQAVKMTEEYMRWALEHFCKRDEMNEVEKDVLKQNIVDCFSKAVDAMKKDLPRELHKQADASVQFNLQYTFDIIDDPLFPGLKAPIANENYAKFLETFTASWAMKKSTFERLGGGSILKFKEKPLSGDLISWGIEIPFRVLRQQIAEFGVELDEALMNALQDYHSTRAASRSTRK